MLWQDWPLSQVDLEGSPDRATLRKLFPLLASVTLSVKEQVMPPTGRHEASVWQRQDGGLPCASGVQHAREHAPRDAAATIVFTVVHQGVERYVP